MKCVTIIMAFCFVGISAENVSNEESEVLEIPDKFKQYFEVDLYSFTSDTSIGASNGNKFCYNVACYDRMPPQSGNIVRSLTARYYQDEVVALEVGLSDDTFQTFGTPSHQISETFVIGPEERITSLNVWANDYQLGGFEITTDQNRHFSVNGDTKSDPYQLEVGSGVLVGVFGWSNNDITSLGFALLRRGSAEMIDVIYHDLSIVPDIKPKEIQTVMYDNSNSTAEEKFIFKGSENVTTSQFWSLPGGLESSIPLKVQAGIPIIELTEATASWKVSAATTHDVSSVQTSKQSYEFPLTAPAGKRFKATAILYQGNIKIQYSASILCTLASGENFSYNITGIYKGIAVSDISVSVERF